jgi:hypothetical protein
MALKVTRAQPTLEQLLLDRIEDQCLQRFDARFPDSMYKDVDPKRQLSRKELKDLLISWLEFWHEEQPIIKVPTKVQELKKKVCDARIFMIMAVAATNQIMDEIPDHLR